MSNLKTILSAAALTAFGSAAVADDYFQFQTTVDDMNSITIDGVTSSMDGVVVAYAYDNGELGEQLDMAPIVAGSNTDIILNIGTTPLDEAEIAVVLYHGTEGDLGEPVAQSTYDVGSM